MALDPVLAYPAQHAWAAGSADEAIARVLQREREAQDAIAQARTAALQMEEASRAEARASAARAEHHQRAAIAAFEQARRQRTAALDAAAKAMSQPAALTAQDHAALGHAVQALAAELSGAGP